MVGLLTIALSTCAAKTFFVVFFGVIFVRICLIRFMRICIELKSSVVFFFGEPCSTRCDQEDIEVFSFRQRFNSGNLGETNNWFRSIYNPIISWFHLVYYGGLRCPRTVSLTNLENSQKKWFPKLLVSIQQVDSSECEYHVHSMV